MTRRATVLTFALAAFAVVGISARDAAAQASGTAEVLFKVIPPPEEGNDKMPDPMPTIEATIIGGALKPNATDFSLIDKSSKTPIDLKGISKRDYLQGSEKLAVAIVMHGWEAWIGNDKEVADIKEDSPDRYIGALVELRAALDGLKFKDAGPAGSLGMIVTYADKAVIRLAMGPLEKLNGQALGTQKDYFGTTGSELVSGIKLAMSELRQASAAKKVLIVVGDGRDTDMDKARAQLSDMKKQAQTDQIQTFAIVYRSKLSGEGMVVNAMIPQTQSVTTVENIATAIKQILDRMNDRQYVIFPGWDFKLNTGIQWDGKVHDLAVKIGQDESEPVAVQSIVWDPSPKKFPWLMVILIGVGVLLLLIIIIAIAKRKPAAVPMPAPMPMPMQAAPGVAAAPAPAEAPKASGPPKTVMIGVGGDEGGFPVVGWLVPLNGPNAYQTMRLRSGGTKIGTAPPADLVINDGFMSTEHCQILCSPQGYTLVDGGSTNGCYVNDKRVQKHELVDNDTVTLGKTNFKFKSIV